MTTSRVRHVEPGQEVKVDDVPGLEYIPRFITEAEEAYLLEQIDRNSWLTVLSRRVQHYGYRYDYKRRTVTKEMYLGPLPAWAGLITERLKFEAFTADPVDQMIVNEYRPGQGIGPHIDCPECFKGTIISLSLGSACMMNFSRCGSDHHQRASRFLEPRSVLILQGDARRTWTHEIRKRKSDLVGTDRLPRTRRVSVTFRAVTLAVDSHNYLPP